MRKEKISTISRKTMMGELKAFEPVLFKYYYGMSQREIHDLLTTSIEEANRYKEIEEYESSHQFSCLTKTNYADDYANLNLVYGNQDEALENIALLDLVMDKVISRYINIDGMERLFSETYIEFEWEMHLSADYKKHNMKFYRDHFFHQVRDAYMMYKLLSQHGFYEMIRQILENESESKVSRFVCRNMVRQKYEESEQIKELRGTGEKEDKDFYIRNMIYMAAFMAGLFHDIGYPEAYYMITSRHIRDYIASLHELNAEGNGISKIYSLLQNSLLFRVESFQIIERRLRETKKPDHGALSAIIFLLHFYENGAIYRLPPYKSAAVELAALAIYNHTNKYGLQGAKRYDIYRPCFTLNPISWLLRICDDLQEWDRIYFVISNKPNLVLCNTCRTPIIRYQEKLEGEFYTRYCCNCKGNYTSYSKNTRDSKMYDPQLRLFDGRSGFSQRRIYNVSVCDKLEIFSFPEGKKLLVKLHYDPYKLLYVSYLDPSYARYRVVELNNLKKLFENQKGIPMIYLDYFVSSNPVHIKVKILEEYLKHCKFDITTLMKEDFESAKKFSIWLNGEKMRVIDELEKLLSQLQNNPVFLEKQNPADDEKNDSEDIIYYLKECLAFYTNLLLYQKVNEYLNDYIGESKVKSRLENYKKWRKILLEEEWEFLSVYLEMPELRCLIEDCFLQFSKMYGNIIQYPYYPQEYNKQFANGKRESLFGEVKSRKKIFHESEKFFYKAVARYLDVEWYEPIGKRNQVKYRKDGKPKIDAFSDLYMFYLMNQKIKKGDNR